MKRFVVLLISLLVVSSLRADNWPGWRGPGNRGVSAEKKLPAVWSNKDNVRWKIPLDGAGVSAPVVWEDHIFLTSSSGRLNDVLHVYCFHRDDGRRLWHARLFGSAPTDHYAPGGMAVPTPATDGERLYVLFGTGELAAFDFDGKPVWIRSLAEEYGPFRNRWGMGTSPILVGDLLVVQVDHWSQSYLLAVDPRSGRNRWKTKRSASVNWASPVAVRVKDQVEIITLGTNHVRGYDPNNGEELWSVEGTHFQCIPSPVVQGDLLFACSGENTMEIKLDGQTGDLTRSHVLWTNKKAAAFITSPLAYEGLLYIANDKGLGICIDPKTGKQLWRERLGEQFHASPVGGGGLVYFPSKEGGVRVIRPGSKFEVVAENDIGETLVASPAISNGQIFLRGEKHLFSIESKK